MLQVFVAFFLDCTELDAEANFSFVKCANLFVLLLRQDAELVAVLVVVGDPAVAVAAGMSNMLAPLGSLSRTQNKNQFSVLSWTLEGLLIFARTTPLEGGLAL